ncbi:MAG: recombinase RecT [bacterium]
MTNGNVEQKDSAITLLRKDVESQIERARALIEPALPKSCDFKQLVAKTLVAIQSTPSLADTNAVSIFWCFVHAAELGLSLDVSSQEAHIIPFEDKKHGRGKRAKLITGYRGLVKLALQHPKVLSVHARAVCEKDKFEYDEGSTPFVVHKRFLGSDHPGEVIAAYAVISLQNGGRIVGVMSRFDVDKVRAMSRGSSDPDSPWTKWYDQMAAKTVLRNTLKQSPRSVEAEKALALEDAAEQGVIEPGEEIVVAKRGQPAQGRVSRMRGRVAQQAEAEPTNNGRDEEPPPDDLP